MKTALLVILAFLASLSSVKASGHEKSAAPSPSLAEGKIAGAQMIATPRSGVRNLGNCGSILIDLEDGSQIAVSNLHCVAQFEQVYLLANDQSARGRIVWPDQSLIDKAKAALNAQDLQFFLKHLDLTIVRLDSRISNAAFKLSDLSSATSGSNLSEAFVFGGTQKRHVYKNPESLPDGQARGSAYWFFPKKSLWEGQSGALVFTVRGDTLVPEGVVSQVVTSQEGGKKVEGTMIISSAAVSRFIQSYLRSQSTETAPTPQ